MKIILNQKEITSCVAVWVAKNHPQSHGKKITVGFRVDTANSESGLEAHVEIPDSEEKEPIKP